MFRPIPVGLSRDGVWALFYWLGGQLMKNTVLFTFLKYVISNVLGMIGLSCYILADTFFVSNGLGADGLTALNIAISVYSFISGTGLMIGIGSATRYSILRAQKEEEKANIAFTHGILLGFISGFLFLLLGVFGSSYLSRLLGASDNIFAMTNVYIKTIFCFAPFFILNNILVAFVRNDGSPKLSMAGMLIGSFSNIVLDYIFIFPLNMGMFGAAFATGLAPIISILILTTHMIKKQNQFHFIKCKFQLSRVSDIFQLGLSAFVTEVSSGVVLIVFNLLILNIEGNIGVAAYGIVANLALVAIAIFTGIAQGIQPLVSKYHGIRDHIFIQKILRYTIILTMILSIVMYIFVFIFNKELASFFNKDNVSALSDFASRGLRFYFIGFFFAGFNIVLTAFLSSVEKPMSALMISLTRGLFAIVPFAFILSYFFKMNGVWLAFACTEFITCFITLWNMGKLFIRK